MVIFFNLDSKEIMGTEDNSMKPALPANMNFDDQKKYYNTKGEGFVAIPYEMGSYIYNFKLSFDVDGNFIGIQPK